jgi:glycosyltransferase involved in cell wall biosynthesis
VIAKDEAAGIERCLRSAPFVAESVVIVDTKSADATDDIARRCGARVFVEDWRGFREQKAHAVSLARHDWILSLDADEALSAEAQAEVVAWLASGAGASLDGMEFPRLSWNLGRWIRFGGWYPDAQLRLFHRDRAQWRAGHLHERVAAPRAGRFRSAILHWPFASLAEQVETNNRYSTLGARDLRDRGKAFSPWALALKPLSKFIETYLIKRGFLDGRAGLVIAVGAAYSMFLKHAKLWELQSVASYNEAPQKPKPHEVTQGRQ